MGMSYQEQKARQGFRMGNLWPLAALRIPGVGRAIELVASWSVLLTLPCSVRCFVSLWLRRVVLGWFCRYMVQMRTMYTPKIV